MGELASAWPDWKVSILRQQWSDGVSASLIAGQIDCTRNAVIGKVHRLGLESRKPAVFVKRPAGPPRPPRTLRPPRVRLRRGMKEAPHIARPLALPLVMDRCGIMDLDSTRCHWPVGESQEPDTYYCGAVVAGKIYCGYHANAGSSSCRRR